MNLLYEENYCCDIIGLTTPFHFFADADADLGLDLDFELSLMPSGETVENSEEARRLGIISFGSAPTDLIIPSYSFGDNSECRLFVHMFVVA